MTIGRHAWLVALVWLFWAVFGAHSGLPYGRHNVRARGYAPGGYMNDTCGVIAIFNPMNYRSRSANYQLFRKRSRAQKLPILIVELVFAADEEEYNQSFGFGTQECTEYDSQIYAQDSQNNISMENMCCASDDNLKISHGFATNSSEYKDTPYLDAETLIRIQGSRFKHVMWQKERLLNVGLSFLPAFCKKVIWSDAELLFSNEKWYFEVDRALNEFPVVQPFRDVVRLSKNETAEYMDDTNRQKNGRMLNIARGNRQNSVANTVQKLKQMHRDDYASKLLKSSAKHGATGFVWAAQRSLLEAINGFFDLAILGGGDALMAHAFFGNFARENASNGESCPLSKDAPYFYKDRFENGSCSFVEHYHLWANKAFEEVQGRVGCIRGTVLHLWHGTVSNRQYNVRHSTLRDLGFDPNEHLVLDDLKATIFNSSGSFETTAKVWGWSAVAPETLRQAVKDFFAKRDET